MLHVIVAAVTCGDLSSTIGGSSSVALHGSSSEVLLITHCFCVYE